MKLYHTTAGILVEHDGTYYRTERDWDELINQPELYRYLADWCSTQTAFAEYQALLDRELLPPVKSQEIWASGVTYYNSKLARMEEAQDAGGGDFYERVYRAERPELFLKCAPGRAVGPGQAVRIRRDSTWDVPEPELTLVINNRGEIVGYTNGNDMSSRSIEGENPLYLAQAKIYDGSAAIGPGVLVPPERLDMTQAVRLEIRRAGAVVFAGSTNLSEMKRRPEELADYLYRECTFPHGCLLMTGTGIIPPNDFSLQSGDDIRISIETIGTLQNYVA